MKKLITYQIVTMTVCILIYYLGLVCGLNPHHASAVTGLAAAFSCILVLAAAFFMVLSTLYVAHTDIQIMKSGVTTELAEIDRTTTNIITSVVPVFITAVLATLTTTAAPVLFLIGLTATAVIITVIFSAYIGHRGKLNSERLLLSLFAEETALFLIFLNGYKILPG
jgi:hypothetical protein